MLTWTYIGVLNIKGKHNFKHFYYLHIVEIPTQKGEHWSKCKPKRESTRENVQSCPYNKNREFNKQCYIPSSIRFLYNCKFIGKNNPLETN